MSTPASTHDRTAVTSAATITVFWVVLPLLGAGAGWLLLRLAAWLGSGNDGGGLWDVLFRLAGSIPEPQATIGALVIGLLAGLVTAFILSKTAGLTVTVSDDTVTFARGGSSRAIQRASVSAVFLDRDSLVLLGRTAEELHREDAGLLDYDELTEAFIRHGFPWVPDGDPFRDQYRPWVEDAPDLPPAANALLKVRQRALREDEQHDVTELRSELARVGVVVRDEKKRQYWRRAGQPPGAPGAEGG
jgi:hypothetical protein